jgi:hypothetical protein
MHWTTRVAQSLLGRDHLVNRNFEFYWKARSTDTQPNVRLVLTFNSTLNWVI